MRPRNHADCCNLLRLAVIDMGGLVLEYKTGALKDENGRLVRFGKEGASDLVACIGGRFIAIEAKLGRDQQRVDQHFFEAAVRNSGGLYILARFTDTEDGVETLRAALGAPLKTHYHLCRNYVGEECRLGRCCYCESPE